jgi:hypothetical protein
MAAIKETRGVHSMMTLSRFLRVVGSSLFMILWFACGVVGQTETATVSGLVTDRTAAAVSGAEVRLQSVERGTVTTTTTNNAGIYVFPSVQPGQYQISIQKQGFKQVDLLGLIVNVQDHIEQNFHLEIGSVAESVTVEASAPLLNTESAAVSTVVDRQFAENLPMNGRSFQTLIQLTPGIVLTVSSEHDSGQFSVNGQRASSNYWMVDGVSANAGIGISLPGSGAGGALPSFSVLGGTNALVSVDALQEFRIQTSTYAPEFGRTPGGQISIVTRSGANQFHGTLFDYLRNDVFDANDWFANFSKLPKPEERQNDFGGTVSGPILKDRTFFFFSYEGLRLRLPEVAETFVPSVSARQNAKPALQPFLNAYPLPNSNSPDTGPNPAPFNASFSNKATLDAYSIRIDHKLWSKLNLFGRYNNSPSELIGRGAGNSSLSSLNPATINVQTATVGATWAASPTTVNDLRFNYSRTYGDANIFFDKFGGAVPLTSLPFPSPFTIQNSSFEFDIFSLGNGGSFNPGGKAPNTQRQINIVDSLSTQRGRHSLKFGVDFRRLSPVYDPLPYSQQVFFGDVSSAESGNPLFSILLSARGSTLLFRNLGLFAQDTWRVVPRLTVTYGLRWDVDVSPSALDGPALPAVTGFNLNNLSNLALAPAGAPPFKTTYGNVAPRIGLAYELTQNPSWTTVLRGGFGIFYDLATSEVGNNFFAFSYPYGGEAFAFGGTFPLDPAAAAPPPISPANLSSFSGRLNAFDPNLKLPYTLQWNVAVEQAIGKHQVLSASYIGAAGRRLIQSAFVNSPNSSFATANLIGNTASSNYNALQIQFQRRLTNSLQALASYTWSHSIDTASAGSSFSTSNTLVPSINPNANRGASDFDIRNRFAAGLTYDIPSPKINAFTNVILRAWSLESIIQVQSASPVNVFESVLSQINGANAQVRPDVVSGIPLYLYGSQYPGGKAINNTPGAVVGGCPDGSTSVGPFCPPPKDSKGQPLRQGNLSRNALRGFGATQWDLGVHREFPIHESLKLQFRAEMFNVLNHPNFGQPVGGIGQPNFGVSTQTLGQSFVGTGGVGAGAFNPLYQIGGPRSIQLALKLLF